MVADQSVGMQDEGKKAQTHTLKLLSTLSENTTQWQCEVLCEVVVYMHATKVF